MSADNGLIVVKLEDPRLNNKYGLFRYFASVETEPKYYAGDAVETFSDPIDAILAAHDRQHDELTEYGVSISQDVLEAAQEEYGRLEMPS